MAFSFGGNSGSAFGSFNAAAQSSAFTPPTTNPFAATNTTAPSFSFTPSQPQSSVPPHQQQQPSILSPDIQQHIQSIYDAYNPKSHHNKFQTFFYNRVDKQQVKQYIKPDSISNKQWLLAQKNNPDLTQYIPVHGIGFNDLYKRIEQQTNATNRMNQTLDDIQANVNQLSSTYISTITNSIQSIQQQHKYLQHKLLHVINNTTKIQSYNTAYLNSELQYKQQCELIHKQVNKQSYYMNKSIELNDKLSSIQNSIENNNNNNNQHKSNEIQLTMEQQSDIYQFLNNHRHALTATSDTVKNDLADITTLNEFITKQQTTQQQQKLLLQ